jgi:hypothetical protein
MTTIFLKHVAYASLFAMATLGIGIAMFEIGVIIGEMVAQDNWTWLVVPIAFTIVGILVYAYIQTVEEKRIRNIN